MIKSVYIGDLSAYRRLQDTINDTNAIVREAVEYSAERTRNPFLAGAQGTPPPSVHPFVWSRDPQANARARRWYFGAIARGEIPTDGERYLRSGKLGESFTITVVDNQGAIESVFGSSANSASYVVGNADGSLQQIPGHDTTGWWQFQPLADAWVDEATREAAEAIARITEERIGD